VDLLVRELACRDIRVDLPVIVLKWWDITRYPFVVTPELNEAVAAWAFLATRIAKSRSSDRDTKTAPVVGVVDIISGWHLIAKVAKGAGVDFAAVEFGFVLNLPLSACGGKTKDIGNEKNGQKKLHDDSAVWKFCLLCGY